MSETSDQDAPDPTDEPSGVALYKAILRRVLERRPSGMRRRLAEALERNPSFVSQIANPSYPTPIPLAHVDTILEICHFSAAERSEFLAAYRQAHPRRRSIDRPAHRHRTIAVRVPDMEDAERNKAVDDLIHDLAARIAKLLDE